MPTPEQRRAYRVKYREKAAETERLYRASHPVTEAQRARHREVCRAHYQRNKAQKLAYGKEWRKANKARHAKMIKAWREANPERQKENTKRWQRGNAERIAGYASTRRAREMGATIGVIDWKAIVERDGGQCQICSKPTSRKERSFDHIVPLSRGGEHSQRNLQLAHGRCNSRRHNSGSAQIRMLG